MNIEDETSKLVNEEIGIGIALSMVDGLPMKAIGTTILKPQFFFTFTHKNFIIGHLAHWAWMLSERLACHVIGMRENNARYSNSSRT